MTHDELTKSFRVIETWATEAKQTLDDAELTEGDNPVIARANLAAIQIEAQNGLREALGDARKLEASDYLLTVLVAALSNLTRFCREEFHQIYTHGIVTTERKDGAALLLSDATSALAKVKEYRSTGEPM